LIRSNRRAKALLVLAGILLALVILAGGLMSWAPPWRATPVPVIAWFPAVDATALEKRPGVDFTPACRPISKRPNTLRGRLCC
jgi:hypothetical protein